MAKPLTNDNMLDHKQAEPNAQPNRRPMVSVIITTYNRPKYLTESLRSVLDQSFQDYEVIVVNDAGEDVSQIIQNANDDRVIYVQHSQNLGLSAARNSGLKIARGKYVTYLDDDDLYYPNHLSTLTDFLENNPEYQVAYTDSNTSVQEKVNGQYIEKSKELRYSFDFDYDRILYENYIPVLCVMHRRDCLDEVGFFDTMLSRTEDWDLWIRMSRKFNFAHIELVTSEFSRRNDGTTMTSNQNKHLFWIFSELNIYYKHLDIIETKPNISKTIHMRIDNYLRNIRHFLLNGLISNNPSIYRSLGFTDLDLLIGRFFLLMNQYGDQHRDEFCEVILILRTLDSKRTMDKEIVVGVLVKLQEEEKAVQNLNAQLAERDQEILFYALSKSWNLTRPLRKFMKLIKGKKNEKFD